MNKTTTFKKRITSSYNATKEKVQNYKADLKKHFTWDIKVDIQMQKTSRLRLVPKIVQSVDIAME